MTRREIGSEFHSINLDMNDDDCDVCNVFSYLQGFYTFYFDSGRSALRALLVNVKFQKILLPDYICESVRICFSGSTVVYYHVNESFQIDWQDLLEKCGCGIDALYLHYFNGYIGKQYDFEKLLEIKKEKGFVIIEDTTHSFLSAKRTIGDYCICSLRKWFPIADGGVLYSERRLPMNGYSTSAWVGQKARAMLEKAMYLNCHNIEKKCFLTAFKETEEALDNQTGIFGISQQSLNLLHQIDIKCVMEIRRNNYKILDERLDCRKIAGGGINQTPLFFTVSLDQRDQLRKFFIENHIYCPVHWPLYGELETIYGAVVNNKHELSIPIDQRYGSEDMLYIVDKYLEYSKDIMEGKETSE